MSDQLQDPWDEIEAEMRGALLGGKIPLLGDCQRHRREIWRHAPCPMCERDAVIGRLTAVLDAAREHINAHLALPETKRATEVDEDYAYDQGALWMAREILRILDAGRGGERE